MSDEDKTFSGSFVLDLRIWWRQAHTLYTVENIQEVIGPRDRDNNKDLNTCLLSDHQSK